MLYRKNVGAVERVVRVGCGLLAAAAALMQVGFTPLGWGIALAGAGAALTVDHPLFAAARAGDPAALEQVLRLLQPDIRRYARRQCHRGSAIEDVVQEVLIVVYRRLGTMRDPLAHRPADELRSRLHRARALVREYLGS
jgi:hypothetical protein